MQIEEFSHLTGKLVFGFLLVILIYYGIFPLSLGRKRIAPKFLLSLAEKVWDGR
jgi:hypothetical protein